MKPLYSVWSAFRVKGKFGRPRAGPPCRDAADEHDRERHAYDEAENGQRDHAHDEHGFKVRAYFDIEVVPVQRNIQEFVRPSQ